MDDDDGVGVGDGVCPGEDAANKMLQHKRIVRQRQVFVLGLFITFLPYLKNTELVFDPWIAEWQIVQF